MISLDRKWELAKRTRAGIAKMICPVDGKLPAEVVPGTGLPLEELEFIEAYCKGVAVEVATELTKFEAELETPRPASAIEDALAEMREVEAAHPGITFLEGARLLGWLPPEDLALADWKLLQTILLDHAAHCMRACKEIDVNDAGMLLYKRAEDTRALYNKIEPIVRELEPDEDEDDEA